MPDLHETLAAKNVKYLDRAGPDRVVGQCGAELVALTKDAGEELWRCPLPSEATGYTFADSETILWNNQRKPPLMLAVNAADGRQLYALKGEGARMLDGARFLARNSNGTGSLRQTRTGEVIVSLPRFTDSGPYQFSPDGRLLVAGCLPAQVWDLEQAKIRFSFEMNYTAEVEFSPDSARLTVKTITTPQSGMQDEITVETYDLRGGAKVDEKSWWERQ